MSRFATILLILVVNCLTLCSCGPAKAPNKVGIDSELLPYVKLYQQDKKKYLGRSNIRDITMTFFSASNQVVGTCTRYNSGYRLIEIDPVFWFFNASEDERILLMYHELGHCDLNKEHNDSSIRIMNTYMMNPGTFAANKDYYIEQLFRSR